jgi:glutathione peroxidase-family protein
MFINVFILCRGHVCIIVNAACKCGLTTKNYQQLQEMYDEFGESKGLRILCFPSNQFAGQVCVTIKNYFSLSIVLR